MKIQLRLIVFSISVLIFAGCSNVRDASKPAEIAIEFRTTINENDQNGLKELLGLPLLHIVQEWQSATDGSGFVLGERKITRIARSEDLAKFASQLSMKVDIEGEEAIPVASSEFSNFSTEFGDTLNVWTQLDVYLFKRGEGDVEHIVVIGIDPKNKKIKAIYIN
jgi:hypothetical protein